jgi:cell fate regulator YaaT (PSP1 superfamily)
MVDTHVQGKYSAVQSRIAGVRFQKLGKLYHFDCSEYDALNVGDYVIVETIRGRQMGQVMGFVEPDKTTDRDVRPILRVASPRDLMMKQTWESRQLEALITTREKAQQIGGFEDCKFLEAQYNYDGTSLTILFSASDNKVNTNRLRSALGVIYKSRYLAESVGNHGYVRTAAVLLSIRIRAVCAGAERTAQAE